MSDLDDNTRLKTCPLRASRHVLRAIVILSALLLALDILQPASPTLLTMVRGAEAKSPLRVAGKVKKQSLNQKMRQRRAGSDCNGNGIPDEEDINNCVDDPACDDCNLNELPDGCDITAGTSTDADLNGVPDECVFFDDGGADENWNTPENWDSDEVPNNLDLIDDESVTIDLSNANLDTMIEVDTLRLLDGSELTVLGVSTEDFEIAEVGGIQIASDFARQSKMLVGNGRSISVTVGTVHVRSGGVYEASSVAQQPVEARLEAGNVLIESRCGEPTPGEMTLSGRMVTEIFGDIVIDARQDCVVCAFCAAGRSTMKGVFRGGETPPILSIRDSAVLRVHGTLAILGAGQFIHESTVPIELGGDFINESPCPACFQVTGTIILGPTDGSGGVPQMFEVAGADVGPAPAGFDQNFAVDVIETTSGAVVNFVDAFPNTNSGTREALYVGTLILHKSATITLDDCRLYYDEFVDDGGTVVTIGAGALVQVDRVDLFDFSSFSSCLDGPDQPPAKPNCEAADLDGDGDVDLHDSALFETAFTGG